MKVYLAGKIAGDPHYKEKFRRIKPQYCARCGATFYECAENRFCMPCRKARRNQAARRWYRENAR